MAKAINLKRMKHINQRMIFSALLDCPCSRAELADKLHLSRAAITSLTDSLLEKGLICETNIYSGGVGRHPILLDVRREKFYIAGLVIRRREMELGFSNLAGDTICEKKIPNDAPPQEQLRRVAELLEGMIRDAQLFQEQILGMGISAPGPLDSARGVILNPPNFDSWQNTQVVSILSQYLDWPMQLYTVTDSLALEEKHYGMGRNFANIMLLQIDREGIGSGIILRNRLFRDMCQFGGMLGHMSINFNGKRCSCGNRGCLEAYASIQAILEGTPFESWSAVMDAFDRDAKARQLVDREAVYIATAVTSSINLMNLDRIIITGDLNDRHEYLEQRINEEVRKHIMIRSDDARNRVVFSSLQSHVRTGAMNFLNAYIQEYNSAG